MRPSRHPVPTTLRLAVVCLASACLALLSLPAELSAASPKAARGTGGAVASDAPLATKAGLGVLAAGGNAVDAAVATALALAVVHPEAGNLGGGGFAVVKMGDEVASLDFREVAPSAATSDMYLGEDGEPVAEKSRVGGLAAGVPGSPYGLWELHNRYGRLPWGAVVEPARRLADQGFPVNESLVSALNGEREMLLRFPETAALWLPGGEPLALGAHLRLPDLAKTLADYASRGPVAVTEGPAAAAVETVARRHGGVLTAADMAAYRPVWRDPVRFSAYGWDFVSMDLPSSGGIILGQSFAILERLDWQDKPRFGADRAHQLVETLRRSFADRYQMGDPSTAKGNSDQFLTAEWLARRSSEISPRRASVSKDVRWWPGAPPKEPEDTTHLSTVDGEGNLVALTTTINGLFGSGVYVPGAGYFLNNEMDDFAAAPGRPNMFGLVQGEANAVRPGKRMLSSMSPTIAWRGEEAVAVGGRGGSRIPTNTLQVLLNLIVDGDDLQEALDRPRLHHQWLPDVVQAEDDRLSPETRAALEARGHGFEITRRTAKINAVRRLEGGIVEAATDPRRTGRGGVVRDARIAASARTP